jgi:hypothetical protein
MVSMLLVEVVEVVEVVVVVELSQYWWLRM